MNVHVLDNLPYFDKKGVSYSCQPASNYAALFTTGSSTSPSIVKHSFSEFNQMFFLLS